ncbi:hypothetical protein FAGKG844_40066 [Frankia sp. AgKG'84/4]
MTEESEPDHPGPDSLTLLEALPALQRHVRPGAVADLHERSHTPKRSEDHTPTPTPKGEKP